MDYNQLTISSETALPNKAKFYVSPKYYCQMTTRSIFEEKFGLFYFLGKKNGTRGRKGRKRAFSDDKLEDEPAQKKRSIYHF